VFDDKELEGRAATTTIAAAKGTETTSLSLAAPRIEQRGAAVEEGGAVAEEEGERVALEQISSSDLRQLSAATAAGT